MQKSVCFTLAFTFFSDLSFVHDSKLSLLYVLWVENISRSLKQIVAGKEFCATFYEFKVYIFLLNIFLIIFWKIRIDTLYEANGSRKIATGEFPYEKFPPIKLPPGKLTPRKLLSRKFSPGIFSPISLIVFLHLTLLFDKFSQASRPQHF